MKQTMTGSIQLLPAAVTRAGEVELVRTVADCVNYPCDFAVTPGHDDAGRTHYADCREIPSMNGDAPAARTIQDMVTVPTNRW